jgi:hypothetical protein
MDAPEKGQAFGNRSEQQLSDVCFKKQAEVRPQTTDRYGRTVAHVICDGTDASTEQVPAGMAWVFDKYVTDRGVPVMRVLEDYRWQNTCGMHLRDDERTVCCGPHESHFGFYHEENADTACHAAPPQVREFESEILRDKVISAAVLANARGHELLANIRPPECLRDTCPVFLGERDCQCALSLLDSNEPYAQRIL